MMIVSGNNAMTMELQTVPNAAYEEIFGNSKLSSQKKRAREILKDFCQCANVKKRKAYFESRIEAAKTEGEICRTMREIRNAM